MQIETIVCARVSSSSAKSSGEKQSSVYLFCYYCALSLCFHARGRSDLSQLSTGGHEASSSDVSNDLTACCVHEGEARIDESAQVSSRKNRKTVLHPVSNGTRTTVAASADHQRGSLNTELLSRFGIDSCVSVSLKKKSC